MRPQNSVLDDFSAAIGGNWATPAGIDTGVIFSTGGQCAGGVANTSALYTGIGPLVNSEAFFTVPVLPASGNDIRLNLRWDVATVGATEGYQLRVFPTSGDWVLRRRLAGVIVNIATVSAYGLSAGDGMWFTAYADTLTGYRYTGGVWSKAITFGDGNITAAGYIGLSISDATQTARLDDFGGGPSSVDASDTPFPPAGGAASW